MIPVNIPLITEDDVEAVTGVLRDGWVSGEAPVVQEFEEKFATLHGQAFGVAVPNGSLALDLLISCLGIGQGDEVIVPSFAIISCIGEILRRGARPVFVDSDPATWNMKVAEVEAAVSERTKAIMAVHTYGLPVDMNPLLAIAAAHKILLIEDAAEAHGSRYGSEPVGGIGYASTFSFYANKNVTTGEGGMVLTSDEGFANKLRYYRNLTFQPDKRFVHQDLGWNLRFSATQAALGLSQIKRLPTIIERRRDIATAYRERIGGIEGVAMAPERTSYAVNDFWVVGAVLHQQYFGNASHIAEKLLEVGVQTRPFFFPLHLQPVYERLFGTHSSMPVVENLSNQGLYFPNGLGMSDSQLDEATSRVFEVLSK